MKVRMGARVRARQPLPQRGPRAPTRGAADGRQRARCGGRSSSPPRCARTTSPNPWVGCVVVAADGTRVRGRHRAARRAPRRGRRAGRGRRRRPRGATVVHHPRAVLPPRPHPPVRRRADRRRRRPGRRRHRGPRPAGRRPGHRAACAPPASTSTSASSAERSRAQLAPYLKHRRTGRPWVVLKLACDARRAHRRARRHEPVDHRRRGPGRRPPPAGRERRGGGRRRHRAGPTTRRSPSRDAAGPPTRCGSCSARRRPAPRCTVPRVRGRAGRPARQLGAAACCRCWSRAGRPSPARSTAAGLVDRYVLYLAPALFGGDDGRGLFAGPGAATIDDVWRGRITSVERSAPTCASTSTVAGRSR